MCWRKPYNILTIKFDATNRTYNPTAFNQEKNSTKILNTILWEIYKLLVKKKMIFFGKKCVSSILIQRLHNFIMYGEHLSSLINMKKNIVFLICLIVKELQWIQAYNKRLITLRVQLNPLTICVLLHFLPFRKASGAEPNKQDRTL